MKILNSGIYGMMETITNYLLLNILWVVSSLPIITIFPATAAMFAVLKDWQQENRPPLFSSYFRYFKKFFNQSFMIGIIFLIVIAILIADLLFLNDLNHIMFFVVGFTIFTIGTISIFMLIYLFPFMVHFQLTVKPLLKNSFFYSFKYIGGTLLASLLLLVVAFLVWSVPLLSLIAFSTTGRIIYLLCYKRFVKSGVIPSQSE